MSGGRDEDRGRETEDRIDPHQDGDESLTMIEKLRTYLEMIRFSHTVFALPFALMGAVLAAGVIIGDVIGDAPYLIEYSSALEQEVLHNRGRPIFN